MPKICYVPKTFSTEHQVVIDKANDILQAYEARGFDLTLRQLYYQFVSRGLIANKDSEYKRLGGIINDARLAGLVDWDRITDRTRAVRKNTHWTAPEDIIEACAKQYQIDKWSRQNAYVEVWVEKDALVGVLEVACRPLDVPYFSCRGYTSQTEMWGAAIRLLRQANLGKLISIIHLGDHDPSGIDMTRDIRDRLALFLGHHGVDAASINRVALNMPQIEQYQPPPNPAKLTDSRCGGYIAEYGDESWELDALEPAVMTALIQKTVKSLRNEQLWKAALKEEEAQRSILTRCSERWGEVEEFLET